MKIPYALVAAVKVDERHAQMATAVRIATERGYPRLAQRDYNETATLSIACYGPSLKDTWRELRHPILSMSGATHFLAERGVIPDWHVDMDPRAHKVKHLIPPVAGVEYLMASVCPPQTWEVLKDQKVTLWHTYSGKDDQGLDTYGWVEQNDPGAKPAHVIHGGSTIGLTALHIGGVLGFRRFEVHGMDGSIRDGHRHAGAHFGRVQKDGHSWNAGGVRYETSQIMANAVAETINLCKHCPMLVIFHGHGLTQALIREANLPNACCVDEVEKVAKLRGSRVNIFPVGDPSRLPKRAGEMWERCIASLPSEALTDLLGIIRRAEARRVKASFNTGSVPLETALLLRGLCEYLKPRVIAEVGTFIGTSTEALQASTAIFTCDRDNDCLEATPARQVFPRQTSTQMFEHMIANGLAGAVDLFFFDGRIQPSDLPLIQRLANDRTVFAFDDYSEQPGRDKGLANVRLILPTRPPSLLVEPYGVYHGRSTLAAIVPLEAFGAAAA